MSLPPGLRRHVTHHHPSFNPPVSAMSVRQASELKQLLLDYGMVWVGHVAGDEPGPEAPEGMWQARPGRALTVLRTEAQLGRRFTGRTGRTADAR